MTTTKNTTAIERRMARREALANSLKTLAVTIEKLGANAGFVREAATELLIGNVHLVLEEAWASDEAKLRDAMKRDPIEFGRTTVTVGAMNIPGRREPGISLQAGTDGRLAPTPAPTATGAVVAEYTTGKPVAELRVDNGKLTMLTRRDAASLPEGTTYLFPSAEVEAAHNSGFTAGKQYALSTLLITDEMVERAVDGWHQWWNDYKGAQTTVLYACAMRHALQQALGVRS